MIPEFAILGHPNEGKSSVLSTLSEDDSVRISDTAGETTQCRSFPVIIDDREIIRFTDTPGFQNPQRVLSEMRKFSHLPNGGLDLFIKENKNDKQLKHDCELLNPLLRGAGIIYVADGSRPMRNVDVAEMEILRLSGRPRMAILNCKETGNSFLEQWKTEFRRQFNSSRLFNAHNATYKERIQLLEALKSIEQDWQEQLDFVVTTFKQEWHSRNERTATLICEMVTSCLSYSIQSTTSEETATEKEKLRLFEKYTKNIIKQERTYHSRIQKLFKHNIFRCDLPPQSILHSDLFDLKTWRFLGLDKKQILMAGGASGAALAATLDLAAGGASLGIFTSIGGVIGALGALYGGRSISKKTKRIGLQTGSYHLQAGPNENPQFPYILFDRAFIFYSHIINWAHGRRDYASSAPITNIQKYCHNWPVSSLKQFNTYFSAVRKGDKLSGKYQKIEKNLHKTILENLDSITESPVTDEKNTFH